MKDNPVLGNSDDIVNIARIKGTGAGSSLYKMLNVKIDKLRKEIEDNPLNTESSIRWNLGFVHGLRWVIASIDDARTMTDKYDK